MSFRGALDVTTFVAMGILLQPEIRRLTLPLTKWTIRPAAGNGKRITSLGRIPEPWTLAPPESMGQERFLASALVWLTSRAPTRRLSGPTPSFHGRSNSKEPAGSVRNEDCRNR